MPNDVEIRFLGDADDAEHSVADMERALAALEGVISRVDEALENLRISPGVVARFRAEAALMAGALREIEDQADDTRLALARLAGPATLIAAAVTGRAFLGDRGPALPLPQGGAPGTSLVPYVNPAAFYQNRVFANIPFRYPDVEGRTATTAEMAAARSLSGSAHDLDTSATALLAAAGGGAAGGGGGGGGFGLGALLGAAGAGGGGIHVPWSPFWFLRRVGVPGARFGSLLGLAGFGAERILGTSLGIAGSLGGALLGGGAYAMGALGTAAVGMGTDMAGIGQAAGDIKTVNADLNSLNQAIAMYGKNSTQAAQAQAQLNFDLKGFSPVARQAVLNAAQASQHFKQMFDYFTGPAEKVGAQIIGQGIQTGQAFLPTIGRFATGNMNIIQQGLQPLFAWMKQTGPNGGLGIFTDLEVMFQKRLPTAVHAGSQAFEVFMHAVDDAAHHTGGFMTSIDKFFTRLNTPTGLARMNTEIGHLIGLFHSWADLLIGVGKLVFDLFKPAVGLGQDFANQLTRLVNLTRQWLEQPATQDVLHNLFAAHRQQLDAIFQVIRALWPVLEATITAFAQIETVVTKLTIGPLKVLADLISSITRHPLADKILGWFAAIVIVNRGIGTMITLLRGVAVGWGVAGAAAVSSAAEADAALGTEAAAGAAAGGVGPLGKLTSMLGGFKQLAAIGAITLGVNLVAHTHGMSAKSLLGALLIGGGVGFQVGGPLGALIGGAAALTIDVLVNATPHNYTPHAGQSGRWVSEGAGAHRHLVWVPTPNANTEASNAQPGGGRFTGGGHGKQKTGPSGPSVNWRDFVGHHKGEDCSLFTQRVYAEVWHISIPRTSEEQFHGGYPASGTEVGDLLFYNGHNIYPPPGHVALYIGNGNVIQDDGSGNVSIFPAGDLDFLGYMGARTYLKKNAVSESGTAGFPYNPSAAGSPVGSSRVPGNHTGRTGPAPASKASIYSAITDAQAGIHQINQILHESFAQLAGVSTRFSPNNIMGAHPLAAAEKHFDPLLKRWRSQLRGLEDDLHKHGLTAKMEADIRARIDRIKTHIVSAFEAIRRAAQTQFQAATTAWQAFTQAFDSQYQSGSSNATAQLQLAQQTLGKLAQAYAIDKAQSAVLGGQADTSMAGTIISQMSSVLASPNGKSQPYTQQEIDNWLSIWGQYYASLGYTPKQMYAAFNKLLQSVGLPTIDNPFDTGGLPLPPDSRGTLSGTSTADGWEGTATSTGAAGYGGDNWAGNPHHGRHHQHHASRGGHHHKHKITIHRHHAAAHANAHMQQHGPMDSQTSPVNIEIRYEKGLEWLDQHVTMIVDGEIAKQGRKANHRARSGRY